jgi:tRNA pseudouridine38-40 synthase
LNNYKLKIQYDGTAYSGWQIQKGQTTVQQTITDAINLLLNEEINLIGSGRTDTGVHAVGQAANFRTNQTPDIYKFSYSLNSILPTDISVSKMEQVSENFHSRFDAKKRTYFYLISKHKSPFFNKYSYFYHGDIDCKKLNQLSESLLGEKNFTSFTKKKSETQNKICEIYEARWWESGSLIFFYLSADRFLHGMVRAITGTLLHCIKNNLDSFFIKNIFDEKNREAASESVPAKGLFLYKVKY